MAYEIPERLKNMQIYNPVTEAYKVRLDANESFLDLPEDIRKEVAEAIAKVEFNRYPDPLASEVCRKFGEFFHLKPELLTAGNGSDELISIIVPNFLSPGETMLTVLPDFSMYAFYAQTIGAKAEALQKPDTMEICGEDVIKRVKETGAKLLIFSNPCNPTSLKMERRDILHVIENTDALVVVDEAYMDFSEGSVLNEIEHYDNLIVLKTCSKAFGMAAVRLGFAAANKEITGVLRTLKSPYNVNTLTQAAAGVVLGHTEYLTECIEKIRKSTEELYAKLTELALVKEEIITIYPTSTNFIYMKTKRGEEVYEALKKEGISIRCMNGYLRIAAGSSKENAQLLQALDRLFC